MASWWDRKKRRLDRLEALPDWAKLLIFPLLVPPLFASGLLKLAVVLGLLPFLSLSDWRSRRPAGDLTLAAPQRRAEQLAASFQGDFARNPNAADVLDCGVVFSRHLARLLNRPCLRPAQARHHASRTLRCLRGWEGIRYFELQRLAADVVRWSEHPDRSGPS
jgi:hypothetical protein